MEVPNREGIGCHLSALLAYWGEDSTVAALGPLVPDGIMVIATTALLAVGRPQRPVEALEALPVGEAVPEPLAASTAALEGAESTDDPDGLDVPDERQTPHGRAARGALRHECPLGAHEDHRSAAISPRARRPTGLTVFHNQKALAFAGALIICSRERPTAVWYSRECVIGMEFTNLKGLRVPMRCVTR